MSKLEDFSNQIFSSIEGYVTRSLAPLAERIATVEERASSRIRELEARLAALEAKLAELEAKSVIRRAA